MYGVRGGSHKASTEPIAVINRIHDGGWDHDEHSQRAVSKNYILSSLKVET